MATPSFSQLRGFFSNNDEYGQLADIVAPGWSLLHWEIFLQLVAHWPHRFELDGRVQDIPDQPMHLIGFEGEGASAGLTIDLAGLSLCVHFFGPDWLEIDFRRTSVQEEHFESLLDLMAKVGNAASLNVFLTPEMSPEESVLVFEVATRDFRTPRHGRGSNGQLRSKVFTRLNEALAPVMLAAKSKPKALPDAILSESLSGIEVIRKCAPELVLQDELLIDDRRDLEQAWSLLSTIVRPCPGSGAGDHREHYESQLVALALRIERSQPEAPRSSDP